MSDAYWNSYNNALGAADKVRENALARQAGGMIASGDMTGGRNVLLRGGYLDEAGKIDTRIATDRKAKAEAASRFAQGLGRMMDDPRYASNPDAAYTAALPFAQKLGLDPQEAEADRQLFTRDPKGYASMLLEKAGKELQFFQTDTGIYVGDKGTGDVRRAARLPGKPVVVGDYAYMPQDVDEGGPPGAGPGIVPPNPDATRGPPAGAGQGITPNAPDSVFGKISDRDAIASIESRGSGDPRRPSTGGFNSVIDPLLKREGGFVARDGRSGAPANFGINQKYNPDVDVRNLTPDKAKELYRSRYWNAIDGDNLPPEAQAAVFDAAVNQGPQRATQWWQQSGGDLAKFNQLRLQHYRSRPDYAQNGRSWEARVAETSGQQPLQGGAGGDDLGAAPTIPGMRAVGRVRGGGGKDAPSGYRWSADGNLEAIKGGPADPNVRAMGTGSRREFASLRKEFNTLDEVKKFKATAGAYNQIRSLASKPNPSPADDMALTYAFMKVNDPDSVVRESEFAMVAKTAGLPDQVVIALDKLTKGQGLTPRIRQQLVNAAATMTLQRREAYDAQARNYRAIAGDLGADADQLAEDPAKWRGRIKQAPAKPAAKAQPKASGLKYDDAAKEARYQAWKAENDGR
jgi:hypothetical protein